MIRTTTATFRQYDRLQEAMIRASMPLTSERDPRPLPTWTNTPKTSRTLTATLREVAHA